MSLIEIYKLIDDIFLANVGNIHLTGGEAFLRKDLPNIIQYIADKNIFITAIFTNGTIFRQDIFDVLSKNAINPSILVSLDGLDGDHDFVRGEGVFKKAIDFIEKVVSLGFNATVNTVVMKHNIKSIKRMRPFLEDLGVKRWRLSVPREQGELIKNKDIIEPSWTSIYSLYKELLIDALENKYKMKIQLSSIFKSEYMDDKEYYIYDKNCGACEYKRNSLVINSRGDVIPCPAFTDLVFGNTQIKSITEIWNNPTTQSFKVLPIKETECMNCEVWEYCGSGCRALAWYDKKNILAKDEAACPLYFFFFNEIRSILKKYGIKEKRMVSEVNNNYDINSITSILMKR